jgi:ABC-type phosphate transport system permease subunit
MVLPMNKRTKRKKNRFSKFLVTMVILLNILFTVAVLYVFLQTGSEPMTLIGCWFAFTTGELWMLSSIKKTKVRKDGNDINENN